MKNYLKFITMMQIYSLKYSSRWKSLEIDAQKQSSTTTLQNDATLLHWLFHWNFIFNHFFIMSELDSFNMNGLRTFFTIVLFQLMSDFLTLRTDGVKTTRTQISTAHSSRTKCKLTLITESQVVLPQTIFPPRFAPPPLPIKLLKTLKNL